MAMIFFNHIEVRTPFYHVDDSTDLVYFLFSFLKFQNLPSGKRGTRRVCLPTWPFKQNGPCRGYAIKNSRLNGFTTQCEKINPIRE